MKNSKLFWPIFLVVSLAVSLTTCGGGGGGGGGGGTTSLNYSISGTVTASGSGLSGVTMTLAGAFTGTTTTAADGTYKFTGLANGNYTVTPTQSGKIFSPVSLPVTISGADVTGQNFTATNTAVAFVPSATVNVASQSIDPAGGTITVSGGTPIDGVQVTFPAGALAAANTVNVGYNTGTMTPNSGTAGRAIVLTLSPGQAEFDQPVSITVPYTDINSIPVPYYVDANGALQPMQIAAIDTSAKTFTFETFHASIFTWILGLVGYNASQGDLLDTGFASADDGFQIVNNGSVNNREGECFGMTSFSFWYWINKKAEKGNFYPKYYTAVGTDSAGNTLLGQNIIATRAFISISQKWVPYYDNIVRRQQQYTQEGRYAAIRNILLNTGKPVLIYLYHTDPTIRGAHSVLGIGFTETAAAGTFNIYDPNAPGQTKNIIFDKTSKTFNAYGGYDGITYNGNGSLVLTEPYTHILADADENFHGTGDAKITIDSHTTGQQVTTRNVTLTGKVESGSVLISKIIVLVGSTSYQADVNTTTGAFSIPISLEAGVNHLQFTTKGNNASGTMIEVRNTMVTQDYTLELVGGTAIMLVTLTWDKDDTDVDLYVIDPTGDYSAYYHKTTADGGVLDWDITTGFGPEHWTLKFTNTVRYNSPYKVRLHYYSDHGNGPTNYTVSIKVYEGTSRERIYYYSGNLASFSTSNTAPNATGADWVTIDNITLTQASTERAGISAGRYENPLAPPTEGINITVPVPPLSERIKK